MNYKTEVIQELAAKIKVAGFRVFIAERGTYGIFTDAEGTRVVSFQYDLGGVKYSGNYKTSDPRSTGTGWQLEASEDFADLFNQTAPQWATRGLGWQYTTLEQHLAAYQKSSRYVEFHNYTPSQEEADAALADAELMNFNMRTYGTIDAPKRKSEE